MKIFTLANKLLRWIYFGPTTLVLATLRISDLTDKRSMCLLFNIYILGIFTEKPYSKPMERNVVYIQITRRHMTLNDVKINHGSLRR